MGYTYPPALGDVACPETFTYRTVQRVVDGLTFTMCQQGGLEGNTRESFVAAIKWLEDSGVSMIIGDCGFMLNYQKLARSITNIPVLLSSLLLLPTLLTTSSPTGCPSGTPSPAPTSSWPGARATGSCTAWRGSRRGGRGRRATLVIEQSPLRED